MLDAFEFSPNDFAEFIEFSGKTVAIEKMNCQLPLKQT